MSERVEVTIREGVQAVAADGFLWYRHRKGFKDAALPDVTNVWLCTYALIWSDSKTQCLFPRIRLKSACTACARLWHRSERCYVTTQQCGLHIWKEKRPKDAKSITLGVCALRCHLLHVNQQWSRRGRRHGGLETFSWKNVSRAKASAAHRTPSITCLNCTSITTESRVWQTIRPTMCRFAIFTNEKTNWARVGHLGCVIYSHTHKAHSRCGSGNEESLSAESWKWKIQKWCFHPSEELLHRMKSAPLTRHNTELAISGTRTHKGLI